LKSDVPKDEAKRVLKTGDGDEKTHFRVKNKKCCEKHEEVQDLEKNESQGMELVPQ
jgi:hypothetical protein